MNSGFCPLDSSYLCTFFWSIVPFFEMRASIPLGILTFHLSVIEAVFVSSLGGISIAIIVLKFLPIVMNFLQAHIPLFHRVLDKIFMRTRTEHSKKFNKLGAVFLVLFVAIPIPGSGAFSGALVAYLFGVPYWRAVGLLSLGVLASASIVATITISGKEVWDLIYGVIG